MKSLVTVHPPLLPVVHDAVPDAPSFHAPLTLALGTGFSLLSWTVTITVARQLLPPCALRPVPSRSPTCIEMLGGGDLSTPNAAATFNRPLVKTRPSSDGVGTTLFKIASLIAAERAPGLAAAYRATAPVTCGAAIDVPLLTP